MTADTADDHDEYDKKETKLFDKNHKHHYITLISSSDSKGPLMFMMNMIRKKQSYSTRIINIIISHSSACPPSSWWAVQTGKNETHRNT